MKSPQDYYAKSIEVLFRFLERRLPHVFRRVESRFEHFLLIRHTDIGLIFSASVIGMIVGLFILVFHKITELFEIGFQWLFAAGDDYTRIAILIIPLITALGGLLVGVLNYTVFKGVEDAGLPMLVLLIQNKSISLRKRTPLKSMITAALSISSGGGGGRESPTLVLGASLAALISKFLLLRPGHERILCIAGIAGAISGIFNAPLGGVVFAFEAIVGSLTLKSFIPIVVSSVLSTAVVRAFMGSAPILVAPAYKSIGWSEYGLLAVAGILSALIAIYYLKVFHSVFRFTEKHLHSIHPILRPAVGGLGAGVLLLFLPTLLETTYTPLNQAISGNGVVTIALATILLKPVSNALTLGSGGAGGTLAPTLKVGALFGFLFGSALTASGLPVSIGVYALVCTAAVFAGTYSLPLSAAIIVFEISHNYDLILPLLFSTVFASVVIRRVSVESFNPILNAPRLVTTGAEPLPAQSAASGPPA